MKFLRGKVWQIALAVCLLVTVMLCVTAFGEDTEPTQTGYYFGSTKVMLDRGADPVYLYTNESGGVVTGATEDDYNIKFEYKEGETPVIYLRGAYITSANGGIRNDTQYAPSNIDAANRTSKTTIIVQKELGNAVSYVPAEMNADSYMAGTNRVSNGDLEVLGPGKLALGKGLYASGRSMTFSDNVSIDGKGAIDCADLTFVGGTYTFAVESGSVISDWGTTQRKIWVKNGADVTMSSSANSAVVLSNPNATLQVDSGNLKMVCTVNDNSSAENNSVLRMNANTRFVVNGGTVELSGATRLFYIASKIDVSGYDCYFATYGGNAEGPGTNMLSGTTFSFDNGVSNKYFKIEPAHNIDVTGGKATVKLGETDTAVTKAPAGATVTLTATPDTAAQKFLNWTVENPPADFAVADDKTATTTFTMPEGDVKIKANFVTTATILLAGLQEEDCTFTNLEPKYFTTNAGVISKYEEENPEDNYNVKLAFNGDVPTVYLKSATISDSASSADSLITNGSDTKNFAICTEEESTLEHTNYDATKATSFAAIKISGNLTFCGSAKLNITAKASVIRGSSSAATVNFNDANVSLKELHGNNVQWGEAVFSYYLGAINFTGGTYEIESVYMPIYLNSTPDITVQNSQVSDVSVSMKSTSTVLIWTSAKWTLNSGRLLLAGNTGSYALFNGGSNTLTVNGGQLEMTNSGSILKAVPNLSGYQGEYYAVTGASESLATKYDGREQLTGKYFQIGEKATVTVTGGTAKAYGESSAAVEDSNVHTLETILGAKVTLTAGDAPAGKTFYKWVNTSSNETFTGVKTATGTFTLTESVSVEPKYAISVLSMNLLGVSYTFSDEEPLYFATVDGAVEPIPAPADGETYNVKLALDEKGVPTVYLKGATITSTQNGVAAVQNGTGVSAFAIVAEEDSTLKGYGNGIYINRADLTIKGPGKLSVIGNNIKALTFPAGAPICVYHFATSDAAENQVTRTITLSADADVYIKSNGASTGGIWGEPNNNIKANTNVIAQNGSSLEIESDSNIVYPQINLTIADGYTDWASVIGSSKEAATAYGGGAQPSRGQKYFKLAPGYQLEIENGTATASPVLSNGGRAFAGTKVTLTPATKSGHRFYEWTFNEGSRTPEIASNVFTMPSGAVSVKANYDEIKTMKILGTAHDFTVHEPLYFTISEGAVVPLTEGDLEGKYNIKLAVVGEGVPTVYLKSATITTASKGTPILENGTNVTAFAIVTEGDSTLRSAGNVISVNKANLTLAGTKKLAIYSNTSGTQTYASGSGILITHGDAAKTVILEENANVYINTPGNYDGAPACIWNEVWSTKPNFEIQAGATLELTAGKNLSSIGFAPVISAEYTNWAAVKGTSASAATAYVKETNISGQYFKIAPGYKVNVTYGTASGVSSNDGRYLPGTVVTLTHNPADAGRAFYRWVDGNDNPLTGNTVTIQNSDVTVEAVYQEKATFYFRDGSARTVYEFTPTYLKSAPDKAPLEATAGDHDIELIYTDGVPAVHLKGAVLTSTINGYCLMNGPDITDEWMIVVENESSITAYGQGIKVNGADLTIRGPGKLTINSNSSGLGDYGTYAGIGVYHNVSDPDNKIYYKVTIDENADVTINTKAEIKANGNRAYTACIWHDPNTTGTVEVKNGAKLELICPSRLSYSATILVIANDYENWAAVMGGSQKTATAYTKNTRLEGKQYFKIAPGYQVTVNNGTSATLSNGGKAFEGASVAVTPNPAAAGEGFAYWDSAELLGDGKNYNSSYTFTMLGKPVTVEAHYGEAASVTIRGTARTVVKGGKPVYLLTDSEGAETTTGAGEGNYNIMLSFVDNLPTVTLDGATIKTEKDVAGIQSTNVSNLVIDVVSASNITSGGRGIYMVNSDLTIMGSGKLTILTEGNAHGGGAGILFENTKGEGRHKLTFDNANVLINANGSTTSCIFEYKRNIDVIINGGTVEMIATYHDWASYKNPDTADEDATSNDNVPQITGDWVAVQGTDPDDPATYWQYSSGTLLNQYYFKVEPKHVEVTITWGAMSFTYSGTIWNVETLSWEGRWVPTGEGETAVNVQWNAAENKWESADTTNAEALNLASNQINVKNVGTETVYVTFDFTAAQSFTDKYVAVNGQFYKGAADDAEAFDGEYTLTRFNAVDAYLKLSSASVASFEDGTTLGTVTVTIDALSPETDGGNAE